MDVFDSLIPLVSQLKAELAITNNDATINPEEEVIIAAKLLIANRELIYLRKELSAQQVNKVRSTKPHSYEFLNSCSTLTHRVKAANGCEFYDCQHAPISLIKLIEM